MEEKVLIKSERYNVKKFLIIMVSIGLVLALIAATLCFLEYLGEYNSHEHYDFCYDEEDAFQSLEWLIAYGDPVNCYYGRYSSGLSYGLSNCFESDEFQLSLIPAAALALIGGLIYLGLRSYELTVTDKRVYGTVAWGKRVDLPVDSVSAISLISGIKGVSVSTSSGRISFRVIKNAEEIYKVMSNLLIERQQEKTNAKVVAAAPKVDEADQLKKYKELLDSGIITQEEFDAKKKQLLGL